MGGGGRGRCGVGVRCGSNNLEVGSGLDIWIKERKVGKTENPSSISCYGILVGEDSLY